MFKYAVIGAIAALSPLTAQAATWSGGWSGEAVVTSSTGKIYDGDGALIANYPSVGTNGVINIWLATEIADALDVADGGAIVGIAAEFYVFGSEGGYDFYAALGDTTNSAAWVDSTVISSDHIRFLSGDLDVYDGTLAAESATLYGGLGFQWANASGTTPATWEDLMTQWGGLGNVLSELYFSGTVDGHYVNFAASMPGYGVVPEPAPVPLPAGAVLMLTGLGGIAALRRRRK